MSLLERSAVGAVSIVSILLLRALLGRRLPRRTFVALWWAAAARLLLPWAVPVSVPVPWPPPSHGAVLPISGAVSGPIAAPGLAAVPGPHAPLPVWTAVYLAGALSLASWFLISYLRWRRRFAASRPVEGGSAAVWAREHPRVSVRICRRIDAPLACGLLRPTILLPEGLEEDLDQILAHEYAHIRHLDPTAKLVFAAALCVHWFDPLVWVLWRLADRDMELACDREVVRCLGRPTDYARALLRLEESRCSSLYSGFCKTAIEERIEAIMDMRKDRKKTSISALCCALLLVSLTVTALALQPEAESGPPVRTIAAPEDPAEEPARTSEEAGGSAASPAVSLLWPTESTTVSSSFGVRYCPRPADTEEAEGSPELAPLFHSGIDIAGAKGDLVFAALDGTVSQVGWDPCLGNHVLLDHGDGLETLYAHCASVSVRVGDTVSQGGEIGAVGSTGQSTGPHLHFEVRRGGEAVEPVFPD